MFLGVRSAIEAMRMRTDKFSQLSKLSKIEGGWGGGEVGTNTSNPITLHSLL